MSRAKGTRREKECRELYELAGYATYSPMNVQYGDNDLFNLFDVVAIRPDRRITFIQVKSNGTQGELNSFFEASQSLLPGTHAVAHFATCYDREGWKLYESEGAKFLIAVDERDKSCDMGARVVEYLQWGLED